MKLLERNYSSQIYRPKSEIFNDENYNLIIVSTSWGMPEHSQKVIEEISRYVSAAKADIEVTSPFEFLSCYPSDVNYLRVASMICNDILYRQFNSVEYMAGVEFTAILQTGNQISWAQVGSSSLFLNRLEQGLIPLNFSVDLSVDLMQSAPLPQNLLGSDYHCNMRLGHCLARPTDQLILLSSSYVPATIFSKNTGLITLEEITHELVSKNPESPFWTGIVTFG